MKRNFTILIVLFFIFSFSSCSSDDNGDLKKAEQEQQQKEDETNKEPEEDFTSLEYIKSLLVGQWISTEISPDEIEWKSADILNYTFNEDDTFVWDSGDNTYTGEYSILPATNLTNVMVLLDTGQIFEIYSFEDDIAEGYTKILDLEIYFRMKKQ